MALLKALLWGAATLAVLPLLAGQLGLLRGQAPATLGVQDGKLGPPSRNPNSVSSQADLWPGHPQRDQARIAPLAVAGDPAAAWARLQRIVTGMPGADIVRAEDGYLHARFSTRWMKFADDTEFWLDRGAAVIHVRSASRLGRRDFGANRARVEAIRRLWSAAG